MRVADALMVAAVGLAVACGGAGAGGGGVVGVSGYPTGVPAGEADAGVGAVGGDAGVGGEGGSGAGTGTFTGTVTGGLDGGGTPAHVDMKAPMASGMQAELNALGLDGTNLPPLEKLDPKALRGVMKLFARSLAVKCADCHQQGDFAAPTRRKKIATKMWNELAAKMTLADGSALFCDSCHQGRTVLLDRTDKKALGKWMDASFVDGLKQKSGKATECETCHVGMEMKILSVWAQ